MQKSVPTNEISEFKGVGLTRVGLTRVDCTHKIPNIRGSNVMKSEETEN